MLAYASNTRRPSDNHRAVPLQLVAGRRHETHHLGGQQDGHEEDERSEEPTKALHLRWHPQHGRSGDA